MVDVYQGVQSLNTPVEVILKSNILFTLPTGLNREGAVYFRMLV